MKQQIVVALIAALALGGCSGPSEPEGGETQPPPTTTQTSSSAWTVSLDDLRIGPRGVGMAFHPTHAPALIAAEADIALVVCPADSTGRPVNPALSSFGRRWTDCRGLRSRPVALPATDGRSHVGIRIRAADGASGTVRHLRVRWRCTDSHFTFRDPLEQGHAPESRCDSLGSGGG
jgi:hypothetical protein